MSPNVEARLVKVRRMSRIANRVCFGAMIVIVAIALLLVVGAVLAPERFNCNVNGLSVPCDQLSPATAVFALAVVGSIVGLLIKGLYHLSRLFGNYAAGQIFTRGSAEQIRRLGITVLVYWVFQILLLVALTVLMATQQFVWPADRPIPIPFVALLAGGIIILISWVMEVGTELREENELTV